MSANSSPAAAAAAVPLHRMFAAPDYHSPALAAAAAPAAPVRKLCTWRCSRGTALPDTWLQWHWAQQRTSIDFRWIAAQSSSS